MFFAGSVYLPLPRHTSFLCGLLMLGLAGGSGFKNPHRCKQVSSKCSGKADKDTERISE
jgi:hypothetical protein